MWKVEESGEATESKTLYHEGLRLYASVLAQVLLGLYSCFSLKFYRVLMKAFHISFVFYLISLYFGVFY